MTRNFRVGGGGGVENPSERTSEENCQGAERPSWGRVWRGVPPPSMAGEILHFEPEKTVSDAHFGQRLLEYDFLQIAREQDDNIEL